jgi:hypothetical protein
MKERHLLARSCAQWTSLSLIAFVLFGCGGTPTDPPGAHIQNVFIIMMENHNWTGAGADSIQGNPLAPYINGTLVPMGSHPSNYNNPPKNHPSLPNYLWLEAGTNFSILNDNPPTVNSQTTSQHLVTLLKNAGISWKSYDEATSGTYCPVTTFWHTPFVFFDDVTDNQNPKSSYCIAHVRPFSELAGDLANNTNARYSFITPSVCHSMHSVCNGVDEITEGDDWLKATVPVILASEAYKTGVLFIIFDEAENGDGPIPMLILSPQAKTGGYTNSTYYDHGSTLRTIEEIFGVQPLLRDAANQSDLSDFFTTFP